MIVYDCSIVLATAQRRKEDWDLASLDHSVLTVEVVYRCNEVWKDETVLTKQKDAVDDQQVIWSCPFCR